MTEKENIDKKSEEAQLNKELQELLQKLKKQEHGLETSELLKGDIDFLSDISDEFKKNSSELRASKKQNPGVKLNLNIQKSTQEEQSALAQKSANPMRDSTHMRYIDYDNLEEKTDEELKQEIESASLKPKNKKKKGFLVLLGILSILIIFLMIAVGSYIYLNNKGAAQLKENQSEEAIVVPEEAETIDNGKIIVYNGKKYQYNENNINILFMGVDRSMQDSEENVIGENGQADVLIWGVLDAETGHLSLINISRDAMVDVNRYNVEGKYLGTDNMQVCLAYSYGDGKEKSCENTIQSVSRLMYGMPVNAYAAVDYSSIALLNDAIGGVTVEVLEDLSLADPSLKQGESVTLHGELAQTYVRARNTEALDSNNQRMERQKQYMSAFLQQVISQTKKNITLPVTLYQEISDYMVTNISASEVTHLATLIVQNGVSSGEILTVPGEVKQGEVYAEFYPDDDELYKLILSVFYKEI